jgi:hypothetical protein
MHLLPAIPAFLLAIVTVWLIWPLLADPIARHLSNEDPDTGEDDALRAWAEIARPDMRLARAGRG